MNLKRREAKKQFNEQLPGASFDHYYANAINGLTKQNPGLKGEELRQAAYKMMLSTKPNIEIDNTPIRTFTQPASWEQLMAPKAPIGLYPKIEQPSIGLGLTPIMGLKRVEAPVTTPTVEETAIKETPVVEETPTPNYVFGNYTQDDLDAMSFNDAFAAARKAGQSTFYWRIGQNAKNKSGYYGAGLKDNKRARFDASMDALAEPKRETDYSFNNGLYEPAEGIDYNPNRTNNKISPIARRAMDQFYGQGN